MIVLFKNSSKLLTIIFPFFVISANPIKSDKGNIELKYVRESSKPYPVVTFYLPGSIDTMYENVYVINLRLLKVNSTLLR